MWVSRIDTGIVSAPLNLDPFKSVDKAEMKVLSAAGEPTGWVWTIAGPGHPNTIALEDEILDKSLEEGRAKEAARVNGKKYKPPHKTSEDIRRENAEAAASRVLGWKPDTVTLSGETLKFSKESVVKALRDPDYGGELTRQLTEFFKSEDSFSGRSGKK